MTIEHDIKKQVIRARNSGFNLIDQHDAIEMGDMRKPRLLTRLMAGATDAIMNQTSVFEYDLTKYVPATVTGKAYTERGNDIEKDLAEQRYYKIGSKGVRLNASPADAWEKRKPGTNEFLTVEEVNAGLIVKAVDAFDIERELEFASLLTAGVNRTAGGPFPVYNFHQDILGTARPAATSVDFTTNGADPLRQIRGLVDVMSDRVAKYGLSMNGVAVICDSNFFEAAFKAEQRLTFGREIRGSLDLATMGVPTIDADNFRYQNFDSAEADATFIKYGASLGGGKLIGSDKAYMVPILGSERLVLETYAPAVTMSTVNEMAREMYSWTYTDEFEGITSFFDENKLSMLPRPDLIIELEAA